MCVQFLFAAHNKRNIMLSLWGTAGGERGGWGGGRGGLRFVSVFTIVTAFVCYICCLYVVTVVNGEE